MIFRPLSKEEYDKLSPQEKLDYLTRLMGDLREKADETRRAIEKRREESGDNS